MDRWGKVMLILVLVFGGVSGMFWSAFAGVENIDGSIIFNARLWLVIPATLIFFIGLLLQMKWISRQDKDGE